MTPTEAAPAIASDLDCGNPAIVCVDADFNGVRDDGSTGAHYHFHQETWRRMVEVARMLEGERDERSEVGT